MKQNLTYVRPALLLFLVVFAVCADAQWSRRNYHYARNYYPVYGQRVMSLPRSFISINFGGNPFYYSNGAYYRPYGGSFRVTYPPFGLRINVLPQGYFPIYTGSYPYYYSNGIFYRQLNKSRDYEVIQAPLGAEIPSLPSDAKTMVIDGEKYYSFNGSYFKDVVKPNGELWFRVVGKNGVLNTYKQPEPAYDSAQYTAPDLIVHDNPEIGWVVDKLPENSKVIYISNKKYFLSPRNTYYEEYVDEKRQVRYKVVGKDQ